MFCFFFLFHQNASCLQGLCITYFNLTLLITRLEGLPAKLSYVMYSVHTPDRVLVVLYVMTVCMKDSQSKMENSTNLILVQPVLVGYVDASMYYRDWYHMYDIYHYFLLLLSGNRDIKFYTCYLSIFLFI